MYIYCSPTDAEVITIDMRDSMSPVLSKTYMVDGPSSMQRLRLFPQPGGHAIHRMKEVPPTNCDHHWRWLRPLYSCHGCLDEESAAVFEILRIYCNHNQSIDYRPANCDATPTFITKHHPQDACNIPHYIPDTQKAVDVGHSSYNNSKAQ